MRVITGSARGRRLKELEGMETRPTTDRVKEGMFSALQFDIEGRRVLDLFAGTGQLGIECLSRGASSAVFVDRRADAVKLIRENLKITDLTDRARIISGDSLEYLKGLREKFDLILLDPPYEAGLLAGYPDGTFRPEGYLTRAEAATVIYKLNAMGDNAGDLGDSDNIRQDSTREPVEPTFGYDPSPADMMEGTRMFWMTLEPFSPRL